MKFTRFTNVPECPRLQSGSGHRVDRKQPCVLELTFSSGQWEDNQISKSSKNSKPGRWESQCMGWVIADPVVSEGLLEECRLGLGEEDRLHRNAGREDSRWQEHHTRPGDGRDRDVREERDVSRGTVGWEGVGGAQDQVLQAVPTRSMVQVPWGQGARSELVWKSLAAVWGREQRAREWTRKAPSGSRFNFLVDRR